jgi:hypothetical protein
LLDALANASVKKNVAPPPPKVQIDCQTWSCQERMKQTPLPIQHTACQQCLESESAKQITIPIHIACEKCFEFEGKVEDATASISVLQDEIQRHKESDRKSDALARQNRELIDQIREIQEASTKQEVYFQSVVAACETFEKNAKNKSADVEALTTKMKEMSTGFDSSLERKDNQMDALKREIKRERVISKKSRNIIDDWKR